MTCEFLSGLTKLPFPATSVVVGGGSLPAGVLYLFLSARNRAGWTVASDPVAIAIAASTGIAINFPAAARGIGTNFLRYSLSAGTTSDPIQSRQIAEWENYYPDGLTLRTLAPIALSLPVHIQLAPTIATPANLPTGTGLINGMHRLISGGLPNNAIASYYKYSAYESRPANAERIIEPIPGEKWVRVLSPYTGQFTDPYGIGGCAADVRTIDPNYIQLPPAYDPNQPNPVKGVPIALTWRNNSSLPLKAGTNFGLEFRQGAENRTDAFNGKVIVTLKGFTDGLGGLDKSDGGVGFLPWVDIDRIWSYGDDALGILTLDKDLPPGASVVYEIAPYFTAQQFQGNLASGETISTYLYPYSQAGKNVAALAAVTGDLVLPVGNRLHVLPKVGASVQIDRGSAIVKGYVFSEVGEQTVFGLSPNTANQKIVLDGNGVCSKRTAPLGSEVTLAIVGTESGSGRIGTISLPLTIAANGSASLVLSYAGLANGKLAIDPRYPIIGGDLADFNVPFVDLYAVKGGIVYPALASGTNRIAIVPTSAVVTVTIDSIGSSIPAPINPTDPLFDLFPTPTIVGVVGTGGSLSAGSYQFFAVYYYDGATASKIDRTSPTVIRESTLGLADLYLLNQGWGRPVYNLADLRSIARSDTFGWQQRPVQGGSIFYYNPDSIAIDDGIAVFKPDYLANQAQPGRWVIRKSFSITPKGIYSNTANYSYLDLATANGGTYLYINPGASTGQPLSNSSYWLQIVEKGDRGLQGVQGLPGLTGAMTAGTNPNTPAINASETYTVGSITGMAIGQYYSFDGISGTLLLTALPTTTTATLQNINATVGSAIVSGTKLVATGKTGGTGATGAAGATGAITTGISPNTPALNASATYAVISTSGLAIGQYYAFSGILGTLLLTALPTTTTATLQNIDAAVGVAVASGTALSLSGQRGATGLSGSPHIARGDYSSIATYSQYDEIYNPTDGASYWWTISTAGNTSPPGSNWQKIANKGDPGTPGAVGAPGVTGATAVGINPNISAIGVSTTYAVNSVAGLAIGQYYAFSGILGTLILTALPTTTTATLQNIDAAVGSAVALGIRLIPVGKKGDPGTPGATGATGTVSSTSGIAILEQSSAPSASSNTVKIFANTLGNLLLLSSTEEGSIITPLLLTRNSVTFTTTALGNGLTFTGSIAIAKSFVVHSIEASAAARIRLYQTSSQLAADNSRSSTIAPIGQHGLIFESIGAGLIQAQFAVLGANQELTPTNLIPISVVNQSGGTAIITVTIKFTALEK
jgi:hypothetical protein